MTLLGLLIMSVFPVYLIMQLVLPLRWHGRWRVAALVPVIALVPLAAHAAYALAMQSNLWPILLIFFAPVACLYLTVLIVIRYSVR